MAHRVLGVGQVHAHLLLSRQLPLSLCKKVLVVLHDSILPHLAQPSLMIDFLTRAYDVGECPAPASLLRSGLRQLRTLPSLLGWTGEAGSVGWWPPALMDSCPSWRGAAGWGFTAARVSTGGAISLLALNGLFILIHQHNL